MFAKWNLTSAGKKRLIGDTWQGGVARFLKKHNLQLDEEKEVLRQKLTEIYKKQDIA